MDFNLGCSGYIYGLSIAQGLICSGSAHNVLLITSETYSKHLNCQDKKNRTIFGDGAAATLISTEGWGEIGKFVFGTDGSSAEYLMVKNHGMKYRNFKGKDIFDSEGFSRNDSNLFMDGKAVFEFTAKIVPQLVTDILHKNDCVHEMIGLYVFHQANRYMLNYIRKKIGIPEQKFLIDLENSGNTVSSTIPIALSNARNAGIACGRNILLAGFGIGLSWGGVILRIN